MRTNRRWTQTELDELHLRSPHMSIQQLAILLDRTPKAISARLWQERKEAGRVKDAPEFEAAVDHVTALGLIQMGLEEGHKVVFRIAGLRFYVNGDKHETV